MASRSRVARSGSRETPSWFWHCSRLEPTKLVLAGHLRLSYKPCCCALISKWWKFLALISWHGATGPYYFEWVRFSGGAFSFFRHSLQQWLVRTWSFTSLYSYCDNYHEAVVPNEGWLHCTLLPIPECELWTERIICLGLSTAYKRHLDCKPHSFQLAWWWSVTYETAMCWINVLDQCESNSVHTVLRLMLWRCTPGSEDWADRPRKEHISAVSSTWKRSLHEVRGGFIHMNIADLKPSQ